MQVSRLLAHALSYLRPRLLGLPEHPVTHGSPLPRQVTAGAWGSPEPSGLRIL